MTTTFPAPSPALKPRILIATLDTLTERMAGPAIRAWELASRLAKEGHRVRLVTFSACERAGDGFVTATTTVDGFRREVDRADVLIVQGYIVSTFPWLQDAGLCLLVDLYDPFQLESLEVEKFRPMPERHAALANALRELAAQSARGDFFVCASEKQRDLWLGQLAAAGRVNPDTYDSDRSLRSLIDVVPFGVSDEPAVQMRHAIKGTVPGIGPDDPVILWGGGVYNWFDPITCVRAVARVRESIPNVRLFFLGMKHPNPDVPAMDMANRTREEADRLGLTGTTVFFHEDWVVYEDRVNYLMDADIGISAHFDHVETSFSFRTRILDYLWAGLPIVCTGGDSFGDLVRAHGLGAVVPVEDDAAMAAAITEILAKPAHASEIRARVAEVAESFTWARVLEPVVAYCAAPHRSADARRLMAERAAGTSRPGLRTRIALNMRAAVRTFKSQGASAVLAKARMKASGLGL